MAEQRQMLIIGGGLAGLSVGCYARLNGWRTHIFEHGLTPGGVCTAWSRPPYTIDGCIRFLIGGGERGAFREMFEELGVLPDVELRPIRLLHRYEDEGERWSVDVTGDLDALRTDLSALAPEDTDTIRQLVESARAMKDLVWPLQPHELSTFVDRARALWEGRRTLGAVLHARGSLAEWCAQHVRSPRLRALLTGVVPGDMPAVFLPVLLQLLETGNLARPAGGSGRVAEAVARRYRDLGGAITMATTVERIVVENGRAVGIRLPDGEVVRGDAVVSTVGPHETALRLLGGEHLDEASRQRIVGWRTFTPIAVVSAGVAVPLADAPRSMMIRPAEPFEVGGRRSDLFYLRVYNDEPSFAPPGHTVVQSFIETTYDHWTGLGMRYQAEKDALAAATIERMTRRLPALRGAIRLTDVATPLSFYRYARVWHGAYRGWFPTTDTFGAHLPRSVSNVANLHLAGQWVEPGGGVPVALVSGRRLVQVLCDGDGKPFVSRA